MNRLFEIVYILLKKRCVTATELAQKFEVSVRTIYRDLDALSLAGVPIYTRKGRNGGIYLLDNYVFDRSLVSKEEQKDILAALESMEEVEKGSTKAILSKLSSFFQIGQPRWLSMDFSDWSNQKQEMYALIKHAIIHNQKLTFAYYNRLGELTRREVLPLQLWFKDYTWYLKSYCLTKKALRIFKLSRMQEVQAVDGHFEAEFRMVEKLLMENKQEDMNLENQLEKRHDIQSKNQLEATPEIEEISFTLWLDQSQGYRVYDNFEPSHIEKLEDGNFIVRERFVKDEWLYGMILSYGTQIRILEPKEFKEEIHRHLQQMIKNFE